MMLGIIGLGRLGSALARGLYMENPQRTLYGFNRSAEKGKILSEKVPTLHLCTSEADLLEKCDCVFLWTNAKDAAIVMEQNASLIRKKQPVLISCTPGVALSEYTSRWAGTLPNVNMVTLVHYAPALMETDRLYIQMELERVGAVYEATQQDIPYLSALCSCGPALYATFMELFADSLAQAKNYNRNFCRRLVRDTFVGTVALQEHDGINADELVYRVAHPGGSSEAGVKFLKAFLPEAFEKMLISMNKWGETAQRQKENKFDNDVIITDANFEDARTILSLQKRAYIQEVEKAGDDFGIPPMRQTLSEMEDDFKHYVILKAMKQSLIVGSVRARMNDETCYIGRLIVEPIFQQKGHGSSLMKSIEARFSQAREFELFTGENSPEDILFYSKRGYTLIEHFTGPNGLKLVKMRKPGHWTKGENDSYA
jgi:pyrroline-5-carboxylate reductase/ribosomal protein S18 acetylase RimI-like enzyme